MGVLDMLLINGDEIFKGFNHLMGLEKYIIVRDENQQIICYFYDMDAGKALIEEYLKSHSISLDSVVYDKQKVKRHDELYEKLTPYKIVVLDGKLVLYGEVEQEANNVQIKGYKGGVPKYGINKYETIQSE